MLARALPPRSGSRVAGKSTGYCQRLLPALDRSWADRHCPIELLLHAGRRALARVGPRRPGSDGSLSAAGPPIAAKEVIKRGRQVSGPLL